MGGGTNHRFGLYDAFLIKDNHIRLAGGIAAAVSARTAAASGSPGRSGGAEPRGGGRRARRRESMCCSWTTCRWTPYAKRSARARPGEGRDLRRRDARPHRCARRDRRRFRLGGGADALGTRRGHQPRDRARAGPAHERVRGYASGPRARRSQCDADRIRPFGSRVVHLAVGRLHQRRGRPCSRATARPRAPSSSRTRRPPGAGAWGTRGTRRRGAGLYVSVVLRPPRAWLASGTRAGGPRDACGRRGGRRGAAGRQRHRRCDQVAKRHRRGPQRPVIGCWREWRKIAGILAEGAATGGELQHVVLGYGVNLLRVEYPPEIARTRDLDRTGDRAAGRTDHGAGGNAGGPVAGLRRAC